jgi:hypothetical protein
MGLAPAPFPCAEVSRDHTRALQGSGQDWLWYKLSSEPGFLSGATLCYWSLLLESPG